MSSSNDVADARRGTRPAASGWPWLDDRRWGGAHASDSEDVELLDETVDAFRAGC
jgi:hypothetical protein